MIEVQSTSGELVIRLAGTFDAAAARVVCGRIQEIPAHEGVVIDFSGVRHVQDHVLADVARAIGDRAPSVAVRGLGRHQERVLQYFGVLPSRADAALEEAC